ncbi:MAG: PEP-CTERM sorting domain-containing protein [Casimicrobiaceae bacterium]
MLGVTASGGQPTEVDTNPEPPSGVPGTGAYSNNLFWLQFVSGQCPETLCLPIPPGGSTDFVARAKPLGDPAYIYMDFVDLFHQSNPADVRFGPECADSSPITCRVSTVVPEPGVLGLILAALGAGWLARRRKPLA